MKKTLLLILFVWLSAVPAGAEILLTDDMGKQVRLPRPAERIVSLSPHLTEIVFAAGAGDKLVGVVEYSNYPEEASSIRSVGAYNNVDLEAIAALRPDLALAWGSGSRQGHLDKLTALGIPVYINEPTTLDDIARSLEVVGKLAGTSETADTAALAFRQRLIGLEQRYSQRPRVRVFYQVWHQPLMTVSGDHPITRLITLCGGKNVFDGLGNLAPTVGIESVLAADPEAIVASGMEAARPEWLDMWKRWPALTAVKRDNLFFIPPGPMQRATPRLLDAAAELCEQLEQARARRE